MRTNRRRLKNSDRPLDQTERLGSRGRGRVLAVGTRPAEASGGIHKIIWSYNPTGHVHVWNLDSNWAWTGADNGLVDPFSSAGSNLLAQFGVTSI
jgi:hypothetical protein